MEETIWEARAEAMSLTRPIRGMPGRAYALVYNVSERGTLEVAYAIVDEDGNTVETIATVDEYVATTDLSFVWPTTGPQVFAGVNVDRYVGAKVVTGPDGIQGSHVTDRLVYMTTSALPSGLQLSPDGYLRGVAAAVTPGVDIKVSVHDTSSGNRLSSYMMPLHVTRNFITSQTSGSVPLVLARSPGTRHPIYWSEQDEDLSVLCYARFGSGAVLESGHDAFQMSSESYELDMRVRPFPKYVPTVSASSEEPDSPASNVLDSDPSTVWVSSGQAFPMWLTVDLGRVRSVSALEYLPDAASVDGAIAQYEVHTSVDGVTFQAEALAIGTFSGNAQWQTVQFPNTEARYVRLSALSAHGVIENLAVVAGVTITSEASRRTAGLRATATTSSATDAGVITSLVDGNPSTEWSSGSGALPVTIDIKLDEQMLVDGMHYGPSTSIQSKRASAYEVRLSTDGLSFTDSAVSSGTLTDSGGVQTIDWNARYAHTVRVTISGTHDATDQGVALSELLPLTIPAEEHVLVCENTTPGYHEDVKLVVCDDTLRATTSVRGEVLSQVFDATSQVDGDWHRVQVAVEQGSQLRVIQDGNAVAVSALSVVPKLDSMRIGGQDTVGSRPAQVDVASVALFDRAAFLL